MKYCVENVISYYDPLMPAQNRGRHLYWCNFKLPSDLKSRQKNFGDSKNGATESLISWNKYHDYDFKKYQGDQLVLKIARNLVDYEAGRTILETALGIIKKKDTTQTELFQ